MFSADKHLRKVFVAAFVFLLLAVLLGCCPLIKKEARPPEESLREVKRFSLRFSDDMDLESLKTAVARNLDYLKGLPPETLFRYGPDAFTPGQVGESQEALLDLLSKGFSPDQLSGEIRKKFRIYRAAGEDEEARMLVTGYYEPVYEGSLTRDEVFKYPLYGLPEDLIRIDLSAFHEKFRGESIIARIEGNRVLPYYTRHQIESERALDGKAVEIAWLKSPLDVAFLHIQGSGRVRLPDGKEVSFRFQAANGRPYRSIGRYMIEKGFLSREEMSMQAIRKYLTANPEVLDEVLDYNPSYVFFRQADGGPYGSLGIPLTPGRSVALDPRIFPRGCLGFISSMKPVANDRGEIVRWIPFSRFVLNHDAGGAIKGAHRADLFWGRGEYAELAAGHTRHDGEFYVLIKKP